MSLGSLPARGTVAQPLTPGFWDLPSPALLAFPLHVNLRHGFFFLPPGLFPHCLLMVLTAYL